MQPEIRIAADTGSMAQSFEERLAIAGDRWSAEMAIRKDNAVFFIHDEEDMPLDDGFFSIGSLSKEIRSGKVVFPLDEARAAIAASGSPALKRDGGASSPGKWEDRDGNNT